MGIMFSAVTKRPNHAAIPSGPMESVSPAVSPRSQTAAQWKSRGSPSEIVDVLGVSGTTRASKMPRASTGRQTAKPASGPPMPMSKSARRWGIGPRMRMKAPSVPTSVKGNGMK